jgi:hypothetical protein
MTPSMVFHACHPAIWLITALPPGTDKISKHSAPSDDGAALPELRVRNHPRSGRRSDSSSERDVRTGKPARVSEPAQTVGGLAVG